MLKKIETAISGDAEHFKLEHRVFNLSSFIIMILSIQGTTINYLIGMNMMTVWPGVLGSVLSALMFWLGRYKRWFTSTTIIIYTIGTMFILGSMYFYNGGSSGTVFYFIVMLLNMYLLMAQRSLQLFVYLMLSGVILALFLVEIFMPEIIIPYRSNEERLADHFATTLYSIFFTTIIIRIFKNSYDNDRQLILAQKEELERVNESTLRKNEYIESLIKEIHHRVKNNLQIISGLMYLQSSRIEDATARKAFEEGRNRVDAIALVHQKLYMDNDLAKVNIEEYLKILCDTIAMSFGKEGTMTIGTSLEDKTIDIDIAIPVGLIVNELVTNSYKHAFSNTIRPAVNVSFNDSTDGNYTLTVSDNGSGMPEDALTNSYSFGMKLVRILLSQLDGSMTVLSEDGTVIAIELKRK